MSEELKTILYVDDEESNLRLFKNIFRRSYNVLMALSGKEGLQLLGEQAVDLIITDQRMPEMTGVEFLVKAIGINPHPKRMLLTAYADLDSIKGAINEGKIYRYLQKPWDVNELTAAITQAIDAYHLERENLRLTNELIRINSELEELDEAKNEFLKLLNHELRTPLNGILGGLTILQGFDVPGEMKQFFQMLDISARRLEKFSYKALDISSLRTMGKESLTVSEFDLVELISECKRELSAAASDKSVSVDVACFSERLPLEGDRVKLGNAFSYVLENAIRYTEPGTKVHVLAKEQDGRVICSFRDQGKGFSDYAMEQLFKPFSNTRHHVDSNVGLSLYYAKLVMEAHSGSIGVEKNVPAGSVVTLSLLCRQDKV